MLGKSFLRKRFFNLDAKLFSSPQPCFGHRKQSTKFTEYKIRRNMSSSGHSVMHNKKSSAIVGVAHWLNQKSATDKHSLSIYSFIFVSLPMTDTPWGPRQEFYQETFLQLNTLNNQNSFLTIRFWPTYPQLIFEPLVMLIRKSYFYHLGI